MALRNLSYYGVTLALITVAGIVRGESNDTSGPTEPDRNGTNTFHEFWNKTNTLWVYYSNRTAPPKCLKDDRLNITEFHIWLNTSYTNESIPFSELNGWLFQRGPRGDVSNTMEMLNDSRTDHVLKHLLYNDTNKMCGVVKVETRMTIGIPLLKEEVTEDQKSQANGDLTVSYYYDLVVKDPNSVPDDCNKTYHNFVRSGNQTIYNKQDCKNSDQSSG